MKRQSLFFLALGGLLLLVAFLIGSTHTSAAPFAQETPPASNLSIGDDYCLGCHGQPGQTMTLEDGSELDLYVDPQVHASSVHGSQGYACVQCHVDVGEYPHPAFSAADRRDVTLQLNQVCQRCHASSYELTMDSVHNQALEEGNRNAAVCTDCHTAHAVQEWVDDTTGETLPEARLQIAQTCAQCHNDIFHIYETSVHGSALANENNPDVPTCIDCHGVHNIQDPTTNEFRLASPQMCARCHTDPARMTKYGISTDVLDTYVADFHGTTVTIFEKQSPDAETNKPVCYDCHGVHDIMRADDPEKGLQVKENLLITCQKCHPDAEANFPEAWLSHYIPSPKKYPIVYYVNLFYLIFIPVLLGGMAILVTLDVSRTAINWQRRRKATSHPPEPQSDSMDVPTEQEELSETIEIPAVFEVEPEPDRVDEIITEQTPETGDSSDGPGPEQAPDSSENTAPEASNG